MLWAALRLPLELDKPRPSDAQRQLATWALQFAPRVAYLDEAVVVEVEASVRLFGGKRALRDRIAAESVLLGSTALAWSTNSTAALALARAGIENGFKRPHEELLDALTLDVFTATGPHATTLSHIGCKTLGDLRALPRGGVTRRFGRQLLEAMDQAYGLRPESHSWVVMPEHFEERLELPGRVELAPALLEGGHRLLLQLCGWLAARHAGVSAITFGWAHDAMRARHVEATGSLPVRTGIPTRNIEHLERLLAEHLAHVELEAPAGEVWLKADEVVRLEERSASFLPDVVNKGESFTLVLERIAARVGPEAVLRPMLVEDHRTEWSQHWQPASDRPARQKVAPPPFPLPTLILDEPLRLAVRNSRPYYMGPLQFLLGPHRNEGGWWHRLGQGDEQRAMQVSRDYYVARSANAGVLWVFQERQKDWFLHGTFA